MRYPPSSFTKKTLQAFLAHISRYITRVKAFTGLVEGTLVQVAGKDLKFQEILMSANFFQQQDGQGIGFFARSAAYRPYPYTFPCFFLPEE
jgi:hypothetical protein